MADRIRPTPSGVPDQNVLVDTITKVVVCELQRLGYTIVDDTGQPAVPPETCRIIMDEVIQSGADRVGAKPGVAPPDGLGHYIDHTLLKPETTPEDIDRLCAEARQYHFAAVCVNPIYVARAVKNLEGSSIPVAAVVGFPLGAVTSSIKAAETREAVLKGAREIDMVIDIGALKTGNYDRIYDEIKMVTDAAGGFPVKVILETALLDTDQKIAACVLSKAAGAAFVKTSTGFGPGGATPEDVALMRRIVGPDMGVKASGGIRDEKTAQEMVSAGADRLGASASVAIVSAGK
jgi:deoxyribose-phosphate aldolase